jgi:D-glycero-D-manno-heptose 1,7-bisphosphate phosphatase
MKTIFLDRDGVINCDPGGKRYVTSWEKFRFVSQAKQAIARLTRKNFKIFIISNQAGVGKGLYSQKTLDLITSNMLREIEKAKGKISEVYYCTHRKEDNCSCRKPKIGLIRKASKRRRINFKKSFFIGDTIRDVDTAKRLGCRSILVLSGKEKLTNRKNWQIQPDLIFKNLYSAVEFILKQK